jgi:hypothetical protein
MLWIESGIRDRCSREESERKWGREDGNPSRDAGRQQEQWRARCPRALENRTKGSAGAEKQQSHDREEGGERIGEEFQRVEKNRDH